ncbi:hypothetical protein CVT26_006738 [Gymnopilus dilepis]|uniref:AB hydrolase-1 domain-containing protein n=1 Tax=Gymnopilus dilepis TaxID=231916 RepID=A0A409W0M1_9AGAR|nr:hypothetical protein CVT26_006738 [Gymnopilus dilepis]
MRPSMAQHWSLFLLFWCRSIFLVQAQTQEAAPFKPWEYEKSTANCKAVKRAPVEEIVDIQIKYVDINKEAPDTILMVHGWPSLWSSWSNQILEFKEDYHLLAPDLRGFGESTHPGDTRSSGTMSDMVSDLVCVLQHANVNSAICMGHDWGSSVCYEAARLRPDVFTAVIGVVVPYLPSAGPYLPIKDFVPHIPSLAYQLYFNTQPEASVAELDKNIRRTIRATLRTVSSAPPDAFLKSTESYLASWEAVSEVRNVFFPKFFGADVEDKIPPVPFFSTEEEDYFVRQYDIQGFRHTIQFYSDENRRLGWRLAHAQGNYTISQPTLAVYPTQDPVANWAEAAKMLKSAEYLPNLTTEILPGAHWVHLEYPKEFNQIVHKWLQQLLDGEKKTQGHYDEL